MLLLIQFMSGDNHYKKNNIQTSFSLNMSLLGEPTPTLVNCRHWPNDTIAMTYGLDILRQEACNALD